MTFTISHHNQTESWQTESWQTESRQTERLSGRRARVTPKAVRALWPITLVCLIGILASGPALAESCTTDALGETVDRIGASLRKLDEKGSTDFRPKLAALAKKKKMTMPVAESWVWQNIKDPRITDYDRKIDSLIGDIDRLSDPQDGAQNCTSIEKLTVAEKQLIALMQQRSDYVLKELDKQIAGTDQKPKPKKVAKVQPKPAPKSKARVAAPQAPTAARNAQVSGPTNADPNWEPRVAATPDTAFEPLAQEPLPTDALPALKTTFSVSDISKAGSGLFGNVSSHIAAAINGALAKFGQPNAYVIGTEGGGALLAGLRYGKGHVHFTDGTRQKVYWNGPSIGYDLGADGSRVMFLIYNLRTIDQLFIRYPGIEGAAYLAGGVGVTVLGRKGTIIVPIRSGIGLRLGASLSYLRFSPKRRWNPF